MPEVKIFGAVLSRISLGHYFKFIYRSCLFLWAITTYIVGRVNGIANPFRPVEHQTILVSIIWAVFVIEMLFRFFPSKMESMGCQKQFKKNYVPATEKLTTESGDRIMSARDIRASEKMRRLNRSALIVAVIWVVFNGMIGACYLTGLLDEDELLIICLLFAVCDMICILFFCPFQTLIMKNKCCGSCRIYNWDYAMMFTPLLFVQGIYTWSILVFALGLLARWEITAYRHPERFMPTENAALSCGNCPEKLCHHKKQLKQFWAKAEELAGELKRVKAN